MDWKKWGRKLLYPPGWLMLVLAVVSAAALTYVFVEGLDASPAAYAVYVLAFYALLVVCVFAATVLPGKYRQIKQKVYHHPVGNKYLTDAAFRTHISLYASLAVNLFYAAINIASFVLYRSAWFVMLAGYYGTLAVMRFLLLRYVRGNPIGANLLGELKRSRLCAWILLTINFALSGAIMMILYQNRGFEYHGVLIYIMAAYTFYITVHATMDLIKYRSYNSPVMTTAKVISLSAALVSVLSLETAMLSQFGADMAPADRWWMIALTGAGVCVTVVVLSVCMIVISAKEMKKITR